MSEISELELLGLAYDLNTLVCGLLLVSELL